MSASSSAGEPSRGARPTGRVRLELCAAWGVLLLASPGVLLPGGHWLGAVVFGALWTRAVLAGGRRAWVFEWFVAAVAFSLLMAWLRHISWVVVPLPGIGMGAYAAAAGACARLAARRIPGPVAACMAWVGFETLRDVVVPPFGMGWLRLGHLWADVGPLLESARVWGVGGLSLVAVSLGAGLDLGLGPLLRGRRPRPLGLWLAAVPALIAWVLGAGTSAPASEPGPTLLLVQPDIDQHRKLSGDTDQEIVTTQAELTALGLRDGPVDLVCWSETMLRVLLVHESARQAADSGLDFDPWRRGGMDPGRYFEYAERDERLVVMRDLLGRFGRAGLLDPGTAFAAGTEEWRALDGRLRRFNVAALWDAEGRRRTVSKRHLVPLGETMYGLERFEWGRGVVGGYLADLASSADEPPLSFTDRGGREWRVGAPICFDNAFLDAFRDDVDFNLVLSNEAWYRGGIEFDQMRAFTRLAAVASGRAVARCTNSGLTLACDAAGREFARLLVDGRDREVPGALRVRMPVPLDRSDRTLFSRFGSLWRAGWVLAALASAVAGLARTRRVGEG